MNTTLDEESLPLPSPTACPCCAESLDDHTAEELAGCLAAIGGAS